MILDDVIISFDIHKRARVIDLLKEHFNNYQILLLTHDKIWSEYLYKTFPNWIRKKFHGWDFAIGPHVDIAKDVFERIDDSLIKDEPLQAGWALGVYLERIFQLLCENLGASIIYRRIPEYSLTELYQSFKKRITDKLKNNNEVVKIIASFEVKTIFRNYCDHWKESETSFTTPEIREVFEYWKSIENELFCSDCNKFIKYNKIDGHEHIFCPCTKLNLKQQKYYNS
jgi:hypothetical protein